MSRQGWHLAALRAVVSLAWLSLLAGCAVGPAQRALVDTLVEEHSGLELPGGESTWPLERLANPEGLGHRLVLVDRGDDALALRLHLIRTATTSIEIQNYIFLLDDSGQLLVRELLAAAARGVRVRVLVDSLFSLPDEDLQAALELAHPNFDLRVYRPVLEQSVLRDGEFIGAILCCFHELNQRMHNKLMVADGQHALVGGRNHSARYFDLDPRMVFTDLETLVSGPVVEAMQAGFDAFWGHPLALPPRHTRRVHRRLQSELPERVNLEVSDRLRRLDALFADGEWLRRLMQERTYQVEAVGYFSDLPEDRGDNINPPAADSTAQIHALIGAARREVVIQTPYSVLSNRFRDVLMELDEAVDVVISSNSLASTDAFPVYAVSRKQRAFLLEDLGVRFFEAMPYPADLETLVPRYPELVAERAAGIETPMRGDPAPATRDMPGPRLSLHAKVVVVDRRYVIVTSHNLDPRSELYNTENGIVVDDAAFATAVLDIIAVMTAPGNSWVSALRPDPGGLIGRVHRVGARWSRRAPTFDLWPGYRFEQYRQSLGQSEDTEPEAVGLAPDVVAAQRRVVTAMVSRMMGFLRPIL